MPQAEPLPPCLTRPVIHDLLSALPPPATDTPQDLAERNEIAIAAVVALCPTDAFDAALAVQIVTAHTHAQACLRHAAQTDLKPDEARRCRAQAAAMMRVMQSGLRAYRRDQAARDKSAAKAAMNPAPPHRAAQRCHEASDPDQPAAPADCSIEADAARYAVGHPQHAALVRHLGERLENPAFGPPGPPIDVALLNGLA